MSAFTAATTITAEPAQVYNFVADLAAWPAVVDHFVADYRLARANPVGRGAAARFQVRSPVGKPYVELDVYSAERPRELLLRIRYGRVGRNRAVCELRFVAESTGVTRVELLLETYPATRFDRLRDALCSLWLRRRVAAALERLRMVFEEPPAELLRRATVAGLEPDKGPRFGAHAGADPALGTRWAGERLRARGARAASATVPRSQRVDG